jgi:hypothetical protein
MPCGQLTSGTGYSYTTRSHYYQRTGYLPSGPTLLNTFEAPASYEFKQTTGECTPGYHKKRKSGKLIPHTYFFQTTLKHKRWGSYDVSVDGTQSGKSFTERYWYDPLWWYLPGPYSDAEIDAVRNELDHHPMIQAAFADAQSKFDALTFVAELSKTVAMFKNLVKHFRNLLDQTPSRLTSQYLEARYGWRVLFYEMKNLDEAIQTLHKKFVLVTGRAGHTWSEHTSWTTSTNFGWAVHDINHTQEVIRGVRGSCALRSYIKSPFSVNLAVTAWELIPYSFVLDWIVNVGQSIQAFSAYILSAESTSSSGYKFSIQRTSRSAEPVWLLGRYGTLVSNMDYYYEEVRRVPGSVSFTPQIRVNLDDWKVLDLLALTIQAFSLWRK